MKRLLPVLAVGVLAASACSAEFSIGGASPKSAAEKLIESEISTQLGLATLDATCDDVDDPGVGSSFACTATTDDGRIVNLVTVIDREDRIDVSTTNALGPDDLSTLEAAGAQALSEQVGVELAADLIDCGDEVILLPADGVMVCAFSDPDSDDVYDATYEITDLDTGTFNIEISQDPRS